MVYTYSPTYLVSASRYKDNQLLYSYTQEVDLRGNLIKSTLPNQTEIAYHWNDLGRCSDILSTPFTQSFYYDTVGHLINTSVQDPVGSYDAGFAYDELDQLIQETGPFVNQYTFDSLHNRRSQNTVENIIDELNQLTSNASHIYTYDSRGNRTAKDDAKYSYDALGRLTSFTDGQEQITYKYDSDNAMFFL